MNPLVFAFPGNETLAQRIGTGCGASMGSLILRRFPDGETYVRLDTPVADREVVFVCTLNEPDVKIVPLLFAMAAARDQGAARVGLVAPYLAYLRQDAQFQPGEAVTSRTFGALLAEAAAWIVTVDPHLHRYRALDNVYPIKNGVVHAAPLISAWLKEHVTSPLLIGPDGESEQWVTQIAEAMDAPYVVLEKRRRGDRDVEVMVPRIDRFRAHTPVVIDDIVSTARTMIVAIRHLREALPRPPVCVSVHALFVDDAYAALQAAGPARIVSCNTVAHPTNEIDVDDSIVANVGHIMGRPPSSTSA